MSDDGRHCANCGELHAPERTAAACAFAERRRLARLGAAASVWAALIVERAAYRGKWDTDDLVPLAVIKADELLDMVEKNER
jgi:uncharacterized OB-fold protein